MRQVHAYGWRAWLRRLDAFKSVKGRKRHIIVDTLGLLLHCDAEIGGESVPMRWEMKRLAPGESNSWFIEVLGARGGVKFSTKTPRTLRLFEIDAQNGEQSWKSPDLGHGSAFETVTGGNFEFGFPDSILQMLGHARRSGAKPANLDGSAAKFRRKTRSGNRVLRRFRDWDERGNEPGIATLKRIHRTGKSDFVLLWITFAITFARKTCGAFLWA